MLPRLRRFVINGYLPPIAFVLGLVLSSSCFIQAQSNKIDPGLIGTWHSVEDRCAADEACANTVNEAQLIVDKTGSFQWVQYRDLEKSDVCSWEVSPDAPNRLDPDDCDVDPDGDSDTFVYRAARPK